MNELEQILKYHAERYPLIQPVDAVKLIYQNEFGGGHLVKDKKASLEFIKREYLTVIQSDSEELYENIGNGIVRINLCSLSRYSVEPEQLNEWFVKSASEIKGGISDFLKKLDMLYGKFNFKDNDLTSYLKEYALRGYPPVSHSDAYRQAYKPAYRIVRSEFIGSLL